MRQIALFPVLLLLTFWVCVTSGYNLMFNTDKDLSQWKLNGSYIYSKSIPTVRALLPASLVQSSKQNDVYRVGVWLARYNGPDTENFLTLHYSLKHHLFKQGRIHFIASPDVPMTITTNKDVEVGKFWSDGKTWCDAVFNVSLQNSINFNMETPNSGQYVLIDRIVMGVMQDISITGPINACLTSPPATDSMTDDDRAPDMAHKTPPPMNTRVDHTPPDMINKTSSSQSHHHLLHSSGGVPAPDMVDKTQTPPLDTSTVTTSNDNEDEAQTGDSSDVKCGCSCSCSRQKGKKNSNNATMTG